MFVHFSSKRGSSGSGAVSAQRLQGWALRSVRFFHVSRSTRPISLFSNAHVVALGWHKQAARPATLSPGCRTCRTCRTLSDTVRPLSDADCRTAVGLTVGLSGTVGPLRVRQHDRALSDTVRLLSDYCRTLSDAVGRCRTLSDCRTVGLSDYCRGLLSDCQGLWEYSS